MGPVSAPSLADARARVRSAVPAAALPRTPRAVLAAGVTLATALLLLLPIGAVGQIVLTAQVDDRTPTQAIVVLDPARVWANSAEVRAARVSHAADLYRSGVAPVIVVAGPRAFVADARASLAASGVPPQDVVAFDAGADTVGVLQVVASVMRDLNWSSATIVTDPAHAARAQATADALGIDAHLSPTRRGTGAALTSESVARETVALLRFHLLTRWSLSPVVR